MDRALPEIMQRDVIRNDSGADMSVLERQQVHMKWQQQGQFQEQQLINYINGNDQMSMFPVAAQAQHFRGFIDSDQGLDELVNQAMKQQDSGEQNGWSDQFGNSISGVSYCSGGIANNKGSGYDMNCAIPRTISCPPAVAAAMAEAAVVTGKGKEVTMPEKLSSAVGRESFRKRKADKLPSQKVNTIDETKDKKMKGNGQESDSKISEQHTSNNSNTEPSADMSKENSKVTEVQKFDYIHVRARRGQATDSHSLAERVRREKISERMKYLQDLVPGCNKIIGKAGMLDEIINYVQSLQRQVEFLSMKLAAVNPTIDFNLDSLLIKEIIQAGASDFATTIGSSSEMSNPAHLQFNPLHQLVACSGMETVVNTPDMALRRTISAPVTLPETLLDPLCFNQLQQSSTCEAELQSLYAMEFQQGKSASYFSQPFTGYIEASHVKLQM